MVEASNNNNSQEEEEEDWGDEWDDAGNEDEFGELQEMQKAVASELVNEKAIAENMKLIEEMQKNREVLLSSKVGRLTRWKLIDVI